LSRVRAFVELLARYCFLLPDGAEPPSLVPSSLLHVPGGGEEVGRCE
jgi:hypothetical protein